MRKNKHLDLIPNWKKYMSQGLLGGRAFSAETIKTYSHYVQWLLNKYGNLSADILREAMLDLPVTNFAKREKLFWACQCFARFLKMEGQMDADFLVETKFLRPRRHRPIKKKVVNESGLDKLLAATETMEECLIVALLAETGLRVSETCALKMKDIDLEGQCLTVQLAKWGKSRRVGLSPNALAVIQVYLQDHPKETPDEFLLLNKKGKPMDRHGLYQRLERIGKRAGVDVSPHALRRAFVTINANKGRPLPMLQLACGHNDIGTTRSYCMTTEEEVIAAMREW
jgi:integrase/recombinase XerD